MGSDRRVLWLLLVGALLLGVLAVLFLQFRPPAISPDTADSMNLVEPSVTDSGRIPLSSPPDRPTLSLIERDAGSLDVRVRVVDASSRPIPKARVVAGEGNDILVESLSDETGVAHVWAKSGTMTTLAARKDGFATGFETITPTTDTEHVLRLEEECTISGQVVDAVSRQGTPRVLVVAWRSNVLLAAGDVYGISLEALRSSSALSDDHGRFTLRGLPRGGRVRLNAYEKGRITRTVEATVGDGDVVLELHNIFGALVRQCAADGGRLQGDPNLLGEGPTVGSPRGGYYLSPRRMDLALAGVAEAFLGELQRDARLVLYAAASDEDVLASVAVRAGAPGYHSVESSVPLARIHHGLGEFRFKLKAWAVGFGTLRVRIDDPAEVSNASVSTPAWIRLLGNELAGPQGYQYPVTSWTSGPVEVHGVPYGKYVCRVDVADRGFRRAAVTLGDGAQEFEVNATVVDLYVDATETSALRAEVLDRTGRGVDGVASIEIQYRGSPAWMEVGFAAPPYEVSLLPPGECRLRVSRPFDAEPVTVSEWLTLSPGETTAVRFVEQFAR